MENLPTAVEYNLTCAQRLLDDVSIFDDLVIDNHETAQFAAEYLRAVRRYEKNIETQYKSITQPLNQEVDTTRELFAPAILSLKTAREKLTRALTSYILLEQKQTQEIKTLSSKETNKEKKHLLKLAKNAPVDEANILRQHADMVSNAICIAPRKSMDGIIMKTIWRFEITNESLVPREYCTPCSKKISEAVTSLKAETNIDGIRVFSEIQFNVKAV